MRNVLLLLIAGLAIGVAQTPAPPAKTPKSPAEATLINTVVAETDAAKRLSELDEWVKQFPESDWNDVRPMIYLVTYQQLGKMQEAIDKANEMLAAKPDDYQAVTAILRIGPTLKNPTPADLDTIEKVAEYVMNNADKVFADSHKPADVSAADWAKVKPYWTAQAPAILVTAYAARNDEARTEAKLKEKAAAYPNDAIFPRALLDVYFKQIKAHPEKQSLVLFYYARTAALDATNRQKYMTSFTNNYKKYHGSDEGLNDVVALAKANPVAPADFKIKSTVDIAQEKADAEAKENAANPAMAVWKTVKTGLTGEGSDQFFEGSAKTALLPGNGLKWKGKIVSMKPVRNPKTLVVAVESAEGDVTLNLAEGAALPGTMEPGEEIQFEGAVTAYSKTPSYMLTLEVTKEQIVGWKGKAGPAHPPVSNKKKAQ